MNTDKNKKLTRAQRSLLFEAYRRNDMADNMEKSKPLTQRWLGLGTAAAYRPMLDTGMMVFHDGMTPPPRCMGWLCLTRKGVRLFNIHDEECRVRLGKLKQEAWYQDSYRSRFVLVGGLVSC